MASPHVAGVMSIFVGFEAIQSNVDKVIQRLQKNAQDNVLNSDFAPDTINRMVNTSINHPDREGQAPYVGAPGRELSFENDSNTSAEGVSTLAAESDLPMQTLPAGSDGDFEGLELGPTVEPFLSVIVSGTSTILSIATTNVVSTPTPTATVTATVS